MAAFELTVRRQCVVITSTRKSSWAPAIGKKFVSTAYGVDVFIRCEINQVHRKKQRRQRKHFNVILWVSLDWWFVLWFLWFSQDCRFPRTGFLSSSDDLLENAHHITAHWKVQREIDIHPPSSSVRRQSQRLGSGDKQLEWLNIILSTYGMLACRQTYAAQHRHPTLLCTHTPHQELETKYTL